MLPTVSALSVRFAAPFAMESELPSMTTPPVPPTVTLVPADTVPENVPFAAVIVPPSIVVLLLSAPTVTASNVGASTVLMV